MLVLITVWQIASLKYANLAICSSPMHQQQCHEVRAQALHAPAVEMSPALNKPRKIKVHGASQLVYEMRRKHGKLLV